MSVNMSDATPKKERHTRFGKFYWDIDFFHNENLRESQYANREKGHIKPVVGTLKIGNKHIDVTMKELERLQETVIEARREIDMAYRLGLLK
jgi:hypothetical protein